MPARPVVALDGDEMIGRLMDADAEGAVVLEVHGAKRLGPGTPMAAVDVGDEERGDVVRVAAVDADHVTDGQLLDLDDVCCALRVHVTDPRTSARRACSGYTRKRNAACSGLIGSTDSGSSASRASSGARSLRRASSIPTSAGPVSRLERLVYSKSTMSSSGPSA